MRLLVLGGGAFVGRTVAEMAMARGWSVSVFHRGRHASPRGARVLRGDRGAPDGLAALEQGEWDLVVDTWAGAPSAVRDTARLLRDRVGHYTYVSSRSVYAGGGRAGLDESGPLVEGSADAGERDYPRDKRGGELAATTVFAERALLVRAGLILGPYEDVGRLPWWLHRIARGGAVLAPGPRDLALQYIDVRDLAGWTLDAAERALSGPYNLVSQPGHTTMGALLESCAQVTGARATLRWAPPESILAAGIEPWSELPIWLPPGPSYDFLHQGEVSKALAAGLRCRPARETVADTWRWLRDGGGGTPTPRPYLDSVGLAPEREAAFLEAWGS